MGSPASELVGSRGAEPFGYEVPPGRFVHARRAKRVRRELEPGGRCHIAKRCGAPAGLEPATPA